MAVAGQRPQQLLCSVQVRSFPVLEVWLTAGRGSRNDPLRVELLGELHGDASAQAERALEDLIDRHGPNLDIDLSRTTSIDADGLAMLVTLQRRAATRQGRVTAQPLPDVAFATSSSPIDRSEADRPAARMRPHAIDFISDAGLDPDGSGRRVLVLRGEFDSDNADELYRAVSGHLRDGGRPLVLEMGEVTFLDSTTISCLVRLRNESAPHGGVVLRNPGAPVRRVLKITGLLDVLVER